MPSIQPIPTAERILDSAERLVQERGFNGFSYADVARELGLTKASLHYHFAGKAELGEALMVRYADRFAQALSEIDGQQLGSRAKLAAYAGLYGDVVRGRRMCLCGMLAAEIETMPGRMRRVVVEFFDASETWLARLLEGGRVNGELAFSGSAVEAARVFVGGLEGAMLVARPYDDAGRFDRAAERLLALFAPDQADG